jgi:hypothetical protein
MPRAAAFSSGPHEPLAADAEGEGNSRYLRSCEQLCVSGGGSADVRWEALPPMRRRRAGCNACTGPDGLLYVVGGGPDGRSCTNVIEVGATRYLLIRVRVEIMGSQKCGIVGKYQPVLIMIKPIIFTRTRSKSAHPASRASPAGEPRSAMLMCRAGLGRAHTQLAAGRLAPDQRRCTALQRDRFRAGRLPLRGGRLPPRTRRADCTRDPLRCRRRRRRYRHHHHQLLLLLLLVSSSLYDGAAAAGSVWRIARLPIPHTSWCADDGGALERAHARLGKPAGHPGADRVLRRVGRLPPAPPPPYQYLKRTHTSFLPAVPFGLGWFLFNVSSRHDIEEGACNGSVRAFLF